MPDCVNSVRILVVDDEARVTSSLRRLLVERRFDVTCVSSAQEAIRAFENTKFDLAISDHFMTGMNGVELLSRIASLSPTTARILVTGHAELQIAVSAINEGKVDWFLTKPWDDDTLLAAVRQTLERRRLVAENAQLRDALFLQKLAAAAGQCSTPRQVLKASLDFLAEEFHFCNGSAYLSRDNDDGLEKAEDISNSSKDMEPSLLGVVPHDLIKRALLHRVPEIRAILPTANAHNLDTPVVMEIAVPLLCNKKIGGALYFLQPDSRRAAVRPELLGVVGDYVGMAIESVTLRRRSNEQEKMATIGRTMACLAHDIRNILTQIKGGGELLQIAVDRKDIAGFPEAGAIIINAADHLSDLVQDMLEFAKPKQLALVCCDIVGLLEDISKALHEQAQAGSIQIVLATHAQKIMLAIDKSRLYRCLLNIVLNGLQAMEKGGQLTITTREIDPPLQMASPDADDHSGVPKALQISISDTGCGIPQENMDKVFTPFFTTKKSGGTGLGLPIAKQIVEEHGGLIHVVSKPSEGTTFNIVLPMTPHKTDLPSTY
ncbi:response regulator [Candidatus Poribacteria bacterium]|nr:response regulator [Candidatus Poribacteria bacterium]